MRDPIDHMASALAADQTEIVLLQDADGPVVLVHHPGVDRCEFELREGEIQEAQVSILDNLEARFDVVPESIVKAVCGIAEPLVLKALRRNTIKVGTLEEFKDLLKKAKG